MNMQLYRSFNPIDGTCKDIWAESISEAWEQTGQERNCIIKRFRNHKWVDICTLALNNNEEIENARN